MNPNLNFETPNNFKKKLQNYLNEYNVEIKRPNTANNYNKRPKINEDSNENLDDFNESLEFD